MRSLLLINYHCITPLSSSKTKYQLNFGNTSTLVIANKVKPRSARMIPDSFHYIKVIEHLEIYPNDVPRGVAKLVWLRLLQKRKFNTSVINKVKNLKEFNFFRNNFRENKARKFVIIIWLCLYFIAQANV